MFPSYFASPRPRRTSQTPAFFGDHYYDQPCYSLHPDHNSLVEPSAYYQYPSNSNPYDFEVERRARAQQLRRQREERERELEEEAEFQRELARLQHRPRDYHDALRTERARRLAQAQAKQRAQREPRTAQESLTDPQVQVTLPDGRRCVVPLSWAKRMQAKHPSALPDSMITKIRQPSPSPPPENDLVLAQDEKDDSESHDSDFYTLDRSQEPYPPVLRPSELPPKTSPSDPTLPPNPSRDELDEAARIIQKHIRLHQRLKHLEALQSKFRTLKKEFVDPCLLELQFSQPPTAESRPDAPAKLAYNSPTNRPLQMFEETLLKLQIELDGIISGGEQKIKQFRKEVVKEVESELERLDRFKVDAWNAQRNVQIENARSDAPEIQTVEMADAQPVLPEQHQGEECEALPTIETTDKMSITEHDSMMPEPSSDGQDRQSSIDDPLPSRSPLAEEDTIMDSAESSPLIFSDIPPLLISQHSSADSSASDDSPLPSPEHVIVTPLSMGDVDQLVIPKTNLKPALHDHIPCNGKAVEYDGMDDIVLPIRDINSTSDILIPASHSAFS